MSTKTSERYVLADRTQYRYETDLGALMLYNVENEEFRVAGDLAHQIITKIEDGDTVEEIATALKVDEAAVRTFCEECTEEGFLILPA